MLYQNYSNGAVPCGLIHTRRRNDVKRTGLALSISIKVDFNTTPYIFQRSFPQRDQTMHARAHTLLHMEGTPRHANDYHDPLPCHWSNTVPPCCCCRLPVYVLFCLRVHISYKATTTTIKSWLWPRTALENLVRAKSTSICIQYTHTLTLHHH